jgi:hypothetical protein
MFYEELEGIYREAPGGHEALSFADYLSMLIGLGLGEYRKALSRSEPEEEPDPPAARADPWDFDGTPGIRRVQ